MAIFNFKTTEDTTPGGGVYKIGEGNQIKIRQSDYPDVNLASLTEKNFFKKTTCLSSGQVGRYNSVDYTNVHCSFNGGSTPISYRYSNGEGTVTIPEMPRAVAYEESDLASYTERASGSGTYTHTVYMSREPLRER